VIDELPPGRKPITTLALPQDRREAVIERMRKVCLNHQQIYWVCPLIEESEKLECQAAETQATYLRDMLPELNVGLVHGRMPAADKAQVMQAFYQAQVDILVATTVIEVGVNVPSASLMVINNPERLGLAQLHQLRGRVGRGASASFCVLLYQGPLSYQAKARLDILRQTQDGFVIAEKDLQLRGAGEVLGTRQTGVKLFKILDFNRDRLVIEQLTELTQKFSLTEQHIKLLQQRWLGQANRYGSV
jgi:ATP-dependent DNA helicase RecG